MSTPFNLPRIRPDPLGQALDQLPQFLLSLGRLQEQKKEREEQARQANVRETERQATHESELLRMVQQIESLSVRSKSFQGLELETEEGLRRRDILKGATDAQLQQKTELEDWRQLLDQMSDKEVIDRTSMAGLTSEQQRAAKDEAKSRTDIASLAERMQEINFPATTKYNQFIEPWEKSRNDPEGPYFGFTLDEYIKFQKSDDESRAKYIDDLISAYKREQGLEIGERIMPASIFPSRITPETTIPSPDITAPAASVGQAINIPAKFANEGDTVVEETTGKKYRIVNGKLVPAQ